MHHRVESPQRLLEAVSQLGMVIRRRAQQIQRIERGLRIPGFFDVVMQCLQAFQIAVQKDQFGAFAGGLQA